MRAITQNEYGTAGVLRPAEIDRPTPGAGEVLIRVRAAGVDYGVWHLMTGRPLLTRAIFGLRRPKSPVPGSDLAGVVEQTGPGVTGFAPGDEVFGSGRGSYAEFAVAPVGMLARKPAGLSFEEAGATAVSGCTALQGLAGLEAGQRLLVLGAAGGVGSFAVRIGQALGAHVTGACRGSKADLVRSLGADEVIDYETAPIAGKWDLILDTGGNRPLRVLRRWLSPGGSLVVVGGENGAPLLGGFDRQMLRMPLVALVTREKLRPLMAVVRAADLERLVALGIRAAIDRAYPLAEAGDALRQLERGQVKGKLVLTV